MNGAWILPLCQVPVTYRPLLKYQNWPEVSMMSFNGSLTAAAVEDLAAVLLGVREVVRLPVPVLGVLRHATDGPVAVEGLAITKPAVPGWMRQAGALVDAGDSPCSSTGSSFSSLRRERPCAPQTRARCHAVCDTRSDASLRFVQTSLSGRLWLDQNKSTASKRRQRSGAATMLGETHSQKRFSNESLSLDHVRREALTI